MGVYKQRKTRQKLKSRAWRQELTYRGHEGMLVTYSILMTC